MRLVIVLVVGLAANACITAPKARIADSLMGYGLDRPRAECVGTYLQDHLSPGQLLELARATRARNGQSKSARQPSIGDLLRVSSEIKDPRIPVAVAKAAGRCRLFLPPFSG